MIFQGFISIIHGVKFKPNLSNKEIYDNCTSGYERYF